MGNIFIFDLETRDGSRIMCLKFKRYHWIKKPLHPARFSNSKYTMVSVRWIPIIHSGTLRWAESRCRKLDCILPIWILPAVCVWLSTLHGWRSRFPFLFEEKRCPSEEAASSCHAGFLRLWNLGSRWVSVGFDPVTGHLEYYQCLIISLSTERSNSPPAVSMLWPTELHSPVNRIRFPFPCCRYF